MTDDELCTAITLGAQSLELKLSSDAVERLTMLVQELERWARRVNLTAIRGRADIVAGHLMDSLAAKSLLQGSRILDVGTGAGFPGLPLAITTAESHFTLLDANAKKLGFVRHAVGRLGIENVTVEQARAEDYAPAGGFDTVIARALAPAARLIELCGHLVGEDGVLLALKGRQVADELTRVPHEWRYRVIELTVPGLDGYARRAVAFTRHGEPT